MKKENKCFEEGKSARLNNLDFVTSNPYNYQSKQYSTWIDGWVIQDRCITAKEQGKIAANSGWVIQDNPYPKKFPQYDSWAAGYKEVGKGLVNMMLDVATKDLMEVKKAFIDVVDGMSVHDIRANTGLPETRCQEIYNLYDRLMKNS